MFNLVLLFVTLCPLVGLIQMEMGAYGTDVAMFGYPNGVSIAYGTHLLVMYCTYMLLVRRFQKRWRWAEFRHNEGMPAAAFRHGDAEFPYSIVSFRLLAYLAIAVSSGSFVFFYFGVGASEVVQGNIGKGLFRSQLGGSEAILMYLLRDFVGPSVSAIVAFVYTRCRKGRFEHVLLAVVLFLSAANNAVWGYSAAAVFALVPASVLLLRRLTFLRVVLSVSGAFITVVLFTSFYQRHTIEDAVDVVLVRATVGTGNSAWRIWDLYQTTPESIVPYWPTLWSAVGGRMASAIGVYSEGRENIEQVDYTALITIAAKRFDSSVNVSSSNVTGTVFAEGVIALGSPGFLLFSVLAGLIVAMVRIVIRIAEVANLPLVGAVAATYYMTSVFTWLNAGGVTALFQLPFVVNYGICWGLGWVLLSGAGVPLRMRRGQRGVTLRSLAVLGPWSMKRGFRRQSGISN